MRSLLDVNVLIALLDEDHISHAAATAWFSKQASAGWASCPITQNGCLRIMSHAGYPNTQPVQQIALRLRAATSERIHTFWPDNQSLLDDTLIDSSQIHGPRQLTDVYLLALAVTSKGRLVTFDASIALSAVRGAKAHHIHKL